MSRSLHLPYKATNPRSVRGARKQGWTVIRSCRMYTRDNKPVTWLGLSLWCETHCSGYWVNSFALAEFAFENPADATFFKMKWA